MHDARVFAHSSLYKKGIAGTLLPSCSRRLCGVDATVFLIGDSAYPLLLGLMKQFAQSFMHSKAKKTYNYRLLRGRIVVENKFGHLKARWRRLMKRNDTLVKNVPTIITITCVLHNICEVHKDVFDESWPSIINDDTSSQPQAGNQDSGSSEGSKEIQNVLVQYFHSHSL